MKKLKKTCLALAAGSLFLAGCSTGSQSVTPDKAPSETIAMLAELSSESTPASVLEAMETLISNTAQAYDFKIDLHNSVETSTPILAADGLDRAVSTVDQYDIRYAGEEGFYEMIEQQSEDQSVIGLMEANASSTSTVYASYVDGGYNQPDSTALIQSLETTKDDTGLSKEEISQGTETLVTYPLYSLIGANLILQPFSSPEYYTFTLTPEGQDYVLTISIKDAEEYNDYLESFIQSNYGYSRTDLNGNGSYIADDYVTDDVTIAITVDANGVIQKIVNDNLNTITSQDTSIKAYTKQTCILSAAPANAGSFLTGFFDKVNSGDYAQGDTFPITVGTQAEVLEQQ